MRLVRHEETGPKEVKSDGSVWACMCGLTGNKPLCDGSHKKTKDEVPGKTYVYEGGSRSEV